MEKELIYLYDSHGTQLCAIDASKVSYVGKLNDTCIEMIIDGCRQIVDHGTVAVRDAGYDYVIRFMQAKPSAAAHNLSMVKQNLSDLFALLNTQTINDFNLSSRTLTPLRAAGIRTLADLVQCSRLELLKLRHFGRKSLEEIMSLIESLKDVYPSIRLGMVFPKQ